MTPERIRGQTLVSVPDAISLHESSNVKFIDGSWFLGSDRNGRQEYEKGPRISKARFLDIDEIATKTPDNLPHMMPSAQIFGATMDALDISTDDHVIVYGSEDCMFISRAYIQMKTMGHPREQCHLLDGSLKDWMDSGGPIEPEGSKSTYPIIDHAEAVELAKASMTTKYSASEPQNVVDIEELKDLIAQGKTTDDRSGVTIVDARSNARFMAEVDEPRPGLRLGHMPGAKNLFFLDLLDPDNKARFKPAEELRKLIAEAGVELPLSSGDRIISSCGSGVTACVLMTALDIIGEDPSRSFLFDGSWAQWGSKKDTPIVKD
jgi:thiosulfate/3-mercaptopyruvate sulfurtransferase